MKSKSILISLIISCLVFLLSVPCFAGNEQFYDFSQSGWFSNEYQEAHTLINGGDSAFIGVSDGTIDEDIASNLGKRSVLTITHDQRQINYLSFSNKAPVMNGDMFSTTTKKEIAEIKIKNNSRDGFELRVESKNNFYLVPVASSDGEESLSYTLNIKKLAGAELNTAQVNFFSTIIDNSQPHILQDKSASIKNTVAVDGGVTVEMEITQPGAQDAVQLAGTYSDTLTYTYIDL